MRNGGTAASRASAPAAFIRASGAQGLQLEEQRLETFKPVP